MKKKIFGLMLSFTLLTFSGCETAIKWAIIGKWCSEMNINANCKFYWTFYSNDRYEQNVYHPSSGTYEIGTTKEEAVLWIKINKVIGESSAKVGEEKKLKLDFIDDDNIYINYDGKKLKLTKISKKSKK